MSSIQAKRLPIDLVYLIHSFACIDAKLMIEKAFEIRPPRNKVRKVGLVNWHSFERSSYMIGMTIPLDSSFMMHLRSVVLLARSKPQPELLDLPCCSNARTQMQREWYQWMLIFSIRESFILTGLREQHPSLPI